MTCAAGSGIGNGMPVSTDTSVQDSPPIRLVEFVPLIAALISLGALGIDTMLPALPDIARRLGVDAIVDGPLILTVLDRKSVV